MNDLPTKRIGVVVEPYEEDGASGIAYAILEQAEGIMEMAPENSVILYSYKPIKRSRLKRGAKNVLLPKSFIGKSLWFWIKLFSEPRILPDSLIFNSPLLPLILPKRVQAFPIFYEVMYEKIRRSLKKRLADLLRKFFIFFSLMRATLIIVPSQATFSDLISFYSLQSKKIRVVPIGYRKMPDDDIRPKKLPEGRFFLYVGRLKHKKNVHTMLEAFIKFKEETLAPHFFAIAGRSGGTYTEELVSLAEKHGYGEDLIFTGYVSDQELAWLYRNTEALVFATLQEGFGMPVLEAMKEGVPVITSNVSSLKEIAEGAALCVNPADSNEISSAMRKMSEDAELRKSLIKKGKERANGFSWESHVKELIKLTSTF